MAFTETQKVSIRRYLGRPLGFYDLDPQLEGMMDKVGGSAVEQTAVETILTELVTIDAVIATAGASASSTGSLKAITGDVEWYNTTTESNGASVDAMGRGKMLIERLRQSFGVELYGRYFGTSAPNTGEISLG
jgi:hypothetical protein